MKQKMFGVWRLLGYLIVGTSFALAVGKGLAAKKVPVGPELAPPEIGVLLKAYPMVIAGVGVTLWGCDYRVGEATITITIATQPGDPMPCKRKVAFGESK